MVASQNKEVVMKIVLCVLATFFSFYTHALDLVVTVSCSTGAKLSGLSVDVYDAENNWLFSGETDNSGQFTMDSHPGPLSLAFSAKDGSGCWLPISLDVPSEPTRGAVTLIPYTPGLPCSCPPYTN